MHSIRVKIMKWYVDALEKVGKNGKLLLLKVFQNVSRFGTELLWSSWLWPDAPTKRGYQFPDSCLQAPIDCGRRQLQRQQFVATCPCMLAWRNGSSVSMTHSVSRWLSVHTRCSHQKRRILWAETTRRKVKITSCNWWLLTSNVASFETNKTNSNYAETEQKESRTSTVCQ